MTENRQNPVVVEHLTERAANWQLRVADKITAFAGSMRFVYIHIALFVVWMAAVEGNPWPTLTLVVSLEAIFLSTFVMIGQNRQAAFAQRKADRDFCEQEQELKQNTELTRKVEVLSRAIHAHVTAEKTPIVVTQDVVPPKPRRRKSGTTEGKKTDGGTA